MLLGECVTMQGEIKNKRKGDQSKFVKRSRDNAFSETSIFFPDLSFFTLQVLVLSHESVQFRLRRVGLGLQGFMQGAVLRIVALEFLRPFR